MNWIRLGWSLGAKTARLALLLSVAVAMGCGTGGDYLDVHGKVTVDGKPLSEGTIRFKPVEGGDSARSKIAEDGTYRLTTYEKIDTRTFEPHEGLPPGDYIVTVQATQVTADGPIAKNSEEEFAGVGLNTKITTKELVAEKFGHPKTTPLKANVDPNGDLEFNFAVSAK